MIAYVKAPCSSERKRSITHRSGTVGILAHRELADGRIIEVIRRAGKINVFVEVFRFIVDEDGLRHQVYEAIYKLHKEDLALAFAYTLA